MQNTGLISKLPLQSTQLLPLSSQELSHTLSDVSDQANHRFRSRSVARTTRLRARFHHSPVPGLQDCPRLPSERRSLASTERLPARRRRHPRLHQLLRRCRIRSRSVRAQLRRGPSERGCQRADQVRPSEPVQARGSRSLCTLRRFPHTGRSTIHRPETGPVSSVRGRRGRDDNQHHRPYHDLLQRPTPRGCGTVCSRLEAAELQGFREQADLCCLATRSYDVSLYQKGRGVTDSVSEDDGGRKRCEYRDGDIRFGPQCLPRDARKGRRFDQKSGRRVGIVWDVNHIRGTTPKKARQIICCLITVVFFDLLVDVK